LKLKLTPIGLAGLILLAIICFSLPDFGFTNNNSQVVLSKPDLNWVENYVDGAFPVENCFIRSFVKAGLLPTPYYNCFAIRHAPPVWEKTLSEYASFLIVFFLPIMVIIFFLFFYQSSRNCADQDHLVGFSAVG